jgi:SAM-dependent methyltransferase
MREWIDWYDSDHPIYVSARHRDVHFRRIAIDMLDFVPGPDAVVLDYSCGEALHADLVAARVAKLLLAEPAKGVRERVAARFAGSKKIEVVALGDLARLPEASIDLVVMHSVAQYMTPAEFAQALDLIRRLLKPQGLLVLGDIVAPGTPAAVDAMALLGFAWANGFFFSALGGLARTFVSDYQRLRRTIGLARYDASAISAVLTAHGFASERLPRNIGHNQARTTFLCKPR